VNLLPGRAGCGKVRKQKYQEKEHTMKRNVNDWEHNGTAQLSGFVASPDARDHAIQLAKNTEGVKNVSDRIDIKQ
jgi:osmotically-inducible protein OsmY